MPELPEVETVCRGLEAKLAGAKIKDAVLHRADLRFPMPKGLEARLRGRRIAHVRRRAKYIVIELSGGDALLLHLGMSGRLVVGAADKAAEKHDHVVIHCDKGTLRFNDPRRFGMLDLCALKDLPEHRLLRGLGVEPLEKDLTAKFLAQKFKGKKTPIKAALLDQRIIAGLGNIYVCEALFHAGISPLRLAGSLKPAEIAALVPAIRKVLKAAIKAGGSSLRDYVQSGGELGYFQHNFAVYDREDKQCPGCHCGKPAITRIVQSGRSTFFCPVRQK
ncbi:MAG: bifunctional DNA-formamidopyrimidine glycosylase/DNA-(apurinic or apyrimidinic site) lyase [Alphaproteobacteria bacterium]